MNQTPDEMVDGPGLPIGDFIPPAREFCAHFGL